MGQRLPAARPQRQRGRADARAVLGGWAGSERGHARGGPVLLPVPRAPRLPQKLPGALAGGLQRLAVSLQKPRRRRSTGLGGPASAGQDAQLVAQVLGLLDVRGFHLERGDRQSCLSPLSAGACPGELVRSFATAHAPAAVHVMIRVPLRLPTCGLFAVPSTAFILPTTDALR